MSDTAQTPEAVALHLMLTITGAEGEGSKTRDREYYLSLYEECLKAVTVKNRKNLTRAA